MKNEIIDMTKASFSNPGCSGNVPLPPLNGVRDVILSNPDLKSKYSLNALTLICAVIAPSVVISI
jgi:hypothetical protein